MHPQKAFESVPRLRSPKQRIQRLAVGQANRAVGLVVDFAGGVNPEPPENRRRQVCRRDEVAIGIGADFVAGAVHLPTADASPGQNDRVAIGPVIPAGIRVDLGGPSEFPHRHHQRRFQKTASREVFN